MEKKRIALKADFQSWGEARPTGRGRALRWARGRQAELVALRSARGRQAEAGTVLHLIPRPSGGRVNITLLNENRQNQIMMRSDIGAHEVLINSVTSD